jgi:multidrug resistance efflux pump
MKINADDFEHTVENLYAKNKIPVVSIYSISLPIIAIFSIITCLCSIDIYIQCRGIIRSSGENTPIASLQSGRIIYQKMTPNLAVEKNDTLLVLDSKEKNIEKKRLEDELQLKKSILSDLTQVVQLHNSSLVNASIQQDYYRYTTHFNELELKSEQAQLKLNRDQFLYKENAIPLIEFERSKFENEIAKEVSKGFKKDNLTRWQFDIKEISKEIINISSEINKITLEKNNYFIKAPITGHIVNSIGLTENSNLLNGQVLAQISPNENLIIECIISPKNIGYITTSQLVKFNIDTFDHNQWGSLSGYVIEIDKNPRMINNEMVFVVKCAYSQQDLILKNGVKGKIIKGMTLTGNFFLVKRMIIEVLFDRVDDWINPNKLKTT